MNLAALIETSAARLSEATLSFGHGTTNAQDEAAWLVLWKLGLPLDTDVSDGAHVAALTAEQIVGVEALITERISSRKPAAYLTHEAWLQGVPFYVDERVIVPRSLIAELLVDGALDYWLSADTHAVLDLCTGNGSLAIIAAMVYPDTTVDGADLSTDALAVAAINVERHQLQDRVRLLESDGLSALFALHSRYDLILCNPPYVNAHSMATLPPEYLAEPSMALDGNRAGGTDGMDFIRALLQDAPQVMNPGAVLVLEIGNERPFFEAAFPALAAVWLETSAGEDQVLLLTREALLA
jgi:ribosomal protein L3 glutamine methyltransferase